MEDPVFKTIKTYDRVAQKYALLQSSIKPVKKQLDFFIANLGGKKVLDAGCAHGRESKYLYDHGLEVVGIDLSKNLLKIAKKTYPSIAFRLMDMRHLAFAKNFFDGLWVNTSFLHLPKSAAKSTLAGFHHVLKPKGLLFLSVQGHENETATVVEVLSQREKLVTTPELGHNNPRLFAYYSPVELRKLLENTGFRTFRITTKKEEKSKILWIDTYSRAKK